jgi:ribosomal protein L11 methyltransferase
VVDPVVDQVVEVMVDAARAELVADLLWSHGVTAVVINDVGDAMVTLTAGAPTPESAAVIAASLPPELGAKVAAVDDQEWRDNWKQFAQPIEIGPLTVAPAWQSVTVGDGTAVVKIDSGPCFGSGSHPSTKIALAALVEHLRAGDRVLDVGTGSGILAIAALVLGAGRAIAVDNDPAALVVAASNAQANGVGGRIELVDRVPAGQGELFDLVLTNVTARTQAELSASTVAALAPGGFLILAGMLEGQWTHIQDRFHLLEVMSRPELDGWVGAVLRRPANA